MADVTDKGSDRPWWESQLDWNLSGSAEVGLSINADGSRNIPATLSAYRLGAQSHVDDIEPDPVVRIGKISRTRPMPRVVPPPPPPPPPVKRRKYGPVSVDGKQEQTAGDMLGNQDNFLSATYRKLRAIPQVKCASENKKPMAEKASKLTLEQLLDPEFCDYK